MPHGEPRHHVGNGQIGQLVGKALYHTAAGGVDVPAFIELEQGFELCLVFGPLLKKALVLRKIRRVAQLDHGRAPVDDASLGAIDAGYGAQISGDIQRFVYIQRTAAQQIAFLAFHGDLFPDGISPVHDGHGGDAFLQEGYLACELRSVGQGDDDRAAHE